MCIYRYYANVCEDLGFVLGYFAYMWCDMIWLVNKLGEFTIFWKSNYEQQLHAYRWIYRYHVCAQTFNIFKDFSMHWESGKQIDRYVARLNIILSVFVRFVDKSNIFHIKLTNYRYIKNKNKICVHYPHFPTLFCQFKLFYFSPKHSFIFEAAYTAHSPNRIKFMHWFLNLISSNALLSVCKFQWI